jgi:hypothetical protein
MPILLREQCFSRLMPTHGSPGSHHVSDLDMGSQRRGDHDSMAIKLAVGALEPIKSMVSVQTDCRQFAEVIRAARPMRVELSSYAP